MPGPATKLFGDRGAVLVGIACSSFARVVMAFARGCIIFAIMPIFALTGHGKPALQSLAKRQVDATRQGQFQGVLASARGQLKSRVLILLVLLVGYVLQPITLGPDA